MAMNWQVMIEKMEKVHRVKIEIGRLVKRGGVGGEKRVKVHIKSGGGGSGGRRMEVEVTGD